MIAYVFGLGVMVIRRLCFFSFFSPMRYASAKSLAMKAICNNNLPTQSNDVIVNPINPVNPDSKTIRCCSRNFQRRLGCFGMVCPVNKSESGFHG